jgi:hypothetical protein
MPASYAHAVMLLLSLLRRNLPARPRHVIQNNTQPMSRMTSRLINGAKPRLDAFVTTAKALQTKRQRAGRSDGHHSPSGAGFDGR